MKLFLALSLLVSVAHCVSFFEVVAEEWSTWKILHGEFITYYQLRKLLSNGCNND